MNQDYDNFEVIVIDDISTDKTFDICSRIEKEFPGKLRAIRNENKIFSQVRNILELTLLSKENSIVVSVDGDDCLKSDQVLKKLNEVYNSGEVWMTYGRYEEYPYRDVSGSYYAYPDGQSHSVTVAPGGYVEITIE